MFGLVTEFNSAWEGTPIHRSCKKEADVPILGTLGNMFLINQQKCKQMRIPKESYIDIFPEKETNSDDASCQRLGPEQKQDVNINPSIQGKNQSFPHIETTLNTT